VNAMIKVARYQLVQQPVLFVTIPLAILAFVFALDAVRGTTSTAAGWSSSSCSSS
jgi:hypothetical protein